MQKSKLCIIIVTHNSAHYIKKCLDSINGYNVIVIDNNSKDNTIELIKDYDIKIARNTQNLGYAKAANIGIKSSSSDYILLINPDIYFRKNTIKKMLDFMKKHKDCDVQGPRLFDRNHQLIYSCQRFPTFRAMIGRRLNIFKKQVGKYLMIDYDHIKPRKVDWISGGCMMFKNKYLFDERYFLYFEDVDFCYKKSVYYNPDAIAYHMVQRYSSKSFGYLLLHIISMLKFKFKSFD